MAITITVRPSFVGQTRAKEASASEFEGKDEEPLSLTFDMPRLFIGRGEGCDLRLPDPSVSQRHASIRQRGSDYVIVDEGSLNGTALTQVMLAPQSPRVVRSGDLIRLGRVWLEITIDPFATARANPTLAKALALSLVAAGLEAQGEESGPKLVVVGGPDAGKELLIAESNRRYVLGRAHEADLVLEDPDIAFRHLEVGLKGDHLVVRDLAQKGVTLGGVSPGTADATLRVGQELLMGQSTLVFQYPAAEALAELSRGADEPMRPGEAPPPPQDATKEPEATTPSPEPESAELSPSRPLRPSEREVPTTEQSGWSLTDGAVLIFAAFVLVLSVVGFFWLIRR